MVMVLCISHSSDCAGLLCVRQLAVGDAHATRKVCLQPLRPQSSRAVPPFAPLASRRTLAPTQLAPSSQLSLAALTDSLRRREGRQSGRSGTAVSGFTDSPHGGHLLGLGGGSATESRAYLDNRRTLARNCRACSRGAGAQWGGALTGLDELEDVRLRHGRLGRPTGRVRSEGLGVLGASRYWRGFLVP